MKILIVEDERKIARALKLGFEQERMSVETYYDGEEGLAAASAAEYDVIILDRMLPGKDGTHLSLAFFLFAVCLAPTCRG